jgi:hypothetical protein
MGRLLVINVVLERLKTLYFSYCNRWKLCLVLHLVTSATHTPNADTVVN